MVKLLIIHVLIFVHLTLIGMLITQPDFAFLIVHTVKEHLLIDSLVDVSIHAQSHNSHMLIT